MINQTNGSFNYKVTAPIDAGYGQGEKSGTLERGQSCEALVYSYREVDEVNIEIMQNGKTIVRTFARNELPKGMTDRSSAGMYHHITVEDQSITIGKGSGDWKKDIENEYGIFFCPCIGLAILGGTAGAVSLFKKRKKAPIVVG